MAPDQEEEEEVVVGQEHETEPIQVFAITDELDLHTFDPRDVPSLVPEYLDECVRLGLREVRIVHGKGKGVVRRAVQAALDRHPRVASYRLADEWAGGWGATLVALKLDG